VTRGGIVFKSKKKSYFFRFFRVFLMVSKWTARFTDFHLFFQKKLLGYFSFLHEAKKGLSI